MATFQTKLLDQLAIELGESIKTVKGYLKELGFDLGILSNADAKPMEKIANLKKAVDCVCLNETSRTKFEIMARDVFRKYHALYPEDQIKPFVRQFNAIEAIYQQLNQQYNDAPIYADCIRCHARLFGCEWYAKARDKPFLGCVYQRE